MAYRTPPGPSPHPNLEPPPPDAAWYEQLAHQVLLAHQPAPARAKRETAPPPSPLAVLQMIAKLTRPRCRRCERDVEKLALVRDAGEPRTNVFVECHGEQMHFGISDRLVLVAGANRDAAILLDVLRRGVFETTAKRYERFDDPRDGYAEGFDVAPVRADSVRGLVAACMVKAEE